MCVSYHKCVMVSYCFERRLLDYVLYDLDSQPFNPGGNHVYRLPYDSETRFATCIYVFHIYIYFFK